VVVKILKYEFSNFWWGFKVASLLAWPGYLPITLLPLSTIIGGGGGTSRVIGLPFKGYSKLT
jgi:hypothetical protein